MNIAIPMDPMFLYWSYLQKMSQEKENHNCELEESTFTNKIQCPQRLNQGYITEHMTAKL